MKKSVVLTFLALSLFVCGAQVLAQKTLDFWSYWTPVNRAFREVIIPNFEQDTGYNVVASARGFAGKEALIVNIAAGTPPDVVVLSAAWLIELGMNGMLEPLDDLLLLHPDFDKGDYTEGIWSLGVINGVTYGIPAIEVGPSNILSYRKDLLGEAGLGGPPKTWGELKEYHRKLTFLDEHGGTAQMGFGAISACGYDFAGWASVWNIDIFNPTTGKFNLQSPELIKMMEDIYWFLDEAGGYWNQLKFIETWGDWSGVMASGRQAMQMTGYFNPGELVNVHGLSPDLFGHTWMPNPEGDKYIASGGWVLAIPKGAKNPEAAMDFIKRFTQPEAAKAIYAERGWLNGNITAMRAILEEVSSDDLVFCITAPFEAERTGTPIKSFLASKLWEKLKANMYLGLRGDITFQEGFDIVEKEINALVQ